LRTRPVAGYAVRHALEATASNARSNLVTLRDYRIGNDYAEEQDSRITGLHG
jgi:hypothetical protein